MTTSGPTVTVTINADGSTSVSVAGAPGASCRTLTADLERRLGRTAETRPTAEATQQQAGHNLGQTGGSS